jgi:uncharacterized protein YjbI with pentapeptide repeats
MTTQADVDLAALLRSDTRGFNALRQENPDLRPDFSGLDFSGFHFKDANLRKANFSGAKLIKAMIDKGSDFFGVNFQGADLTGLTSRGLRMATANCSGARLKDANFDMANLNAVKFIDADLSEMGTTDCTMWQTDFTRAKMVDMVIWNENQAGGIILDAIFDGADMTRARLAGGTNCRYCVESARVPPDEAGGALSARDWLAAMALDPSCR